MSCPKTNLAARARQSLNTSETHSFYIPGPPRDGDLPDGNVWLGIANGIILTALLAICTGVLWKVLPHGDDRPFRDALAEQALKR